MKSSLPSSSAPSRHHQRHLKPISNSRSRWGRVGEIRHKEQRKRRQKKKKGKAGLKDQSADRREEQRAGQWGGYGDIGAPADGKDNHRL